MIITRSGGITTQISTQLGYINTNPGTNTGKSGHFNMNLRQIQGHYKGNLTRITGLSNKRIQIITKEICKSATHTSKSSSHTHPRDNTQDKTSTNTNLELHH